MHPRFTSGPGQPSAGLLVHLVRLALLLLPFSLFLAVSLRLPPGSAGLSWLGTLFLGLACILSLGLRQGWREPVGPAVIMLYVIALSWLVLGTTGIYDWFLNLAQAVLLVVPLGCFAVQCLRDSGAPAMRRARHLAKRLAERVDWPPDLQSCLLLPEVKALREALHVDASPALVLLGNPRAEVRVAALAALEFRQNWRPGQPEVVLNLAQRAPEPEVRAAAVNALANLEDRVLVESLAEFLYDPSLLVRQTATEALLWNTENHWQWIAHSVRKALADPVGQDDGPLPVGVNQLTRKAVADLTAWAAEKGVLALRAALTLGMHHGQVLSAGGSPELVRDLRRQLADAHTPAMLRLELARLLNQHRELDHALLLRLLDPSTPAPVRLIAAEALLGNGPSPEALSTLYDLARLPNREMALSTGDVIQRRLGIDMGLPRGQNLPPVFSRLAAEVARRVMLWAAQQAHPDSEAAGMRNSRSEI
jgi:HEAT repeat protein